MQSLTIDKGWFPMFRNDLDEILNGFSNPSRRASALAVYQAVCRLANDSRAQFFEARINRIAGLAGVGYRTAIDRLHDLKALGVIRIEPQSTVGKHHPDAPSRYTLRGTANLADGYESERAPVLPTNLNKSKLQPPLPDGALLPYIARFQAIRPEFSIVLDFHIADAVRVCPPGSARDQAFAEFERDAATALHCPENPVKMLRRYMQQATNPQKGKYERHSHRRAGEFAEPVKPIPEL